MKLLCDAMLGNVGRTLRCAGYDTVIDTGRLADRMYWDGSHVRRMRARLDALAGSVER